MLSTELAADFRERRGGELLHQEHRYLARKRDFLRVAAHFQILRAQTEMFAHTLLNLLDGDLLVLALDDIFQNLMCGRQVDHGSGKRSLAHQADQSPSQLAKTR